MRKQQFDPSEETIKDLASKGLTLADICERLGCSKQTWYNILKRKPELHLSFYEGRAISKLSLMEVMHKKALAEENIDAAKFLLARLHGLSEKTEVKVAVDSELIDEAGNPLTGQALIDKAQTLIASLAPKLIADGSKEEPKKS